MLIFSDMVENFLEVFMDDISVFGSSFDNCLHNLSLVLKHCKETNLTLSWEKSHFMVQDSIVLGHIVSKRGIEVDRAKVKLIENLPPPTSHLFDKNPDRTPQCLGPLHPPPKRQAPMPNPPIQLLSSGRYCLR
jgi:hypothetical protein